MPKTKMIPSNREIQILQTTNLLFVDVLWGNHLTRTPKLYIIHIVTRKPLLIPRDIVNIL